MPADRASRPLLVRFFDRFLEERTIQWILGVGVVILLGSSLKLVGDRWGALSAFWKDLVLLGYASGAFLGGRVAYRHLGLRRTGNVLYAQSVLILPVAFLAPSFAAGTEAWGLLRPLLAALDLAVALPLAGAVFRHFLRGRQPTFVACYLALALAGSLPPGAFAGREAWAGLGLWALFTLGAVKVNRRVFWMAEERRLPRLFGFFPAALLAAQFLGLFALRCAAGTPLPWIGLGGVLAAATVLATAGAVARVHLARSGGRPAPLPGDVLVPFLTGLLLCAGGLALAATGLAPPGKAHALVPAAALAAVLLGLTAHRTGKEPFVWGMLAAALTAYQVSPVLFAGLARRAVEAGAAAVREERLPYAFYGLTYLPFLAALTLAGRREDRIGRLFARPARGAAAAMSLLLLAASLTHVKAAFPVGAALCALLAFQARSFGDRRLALAAVAAGVVAAWGLAPFGAGVLGITSLEGSRLACLAAAATVLLVSGRRLDRGIARLPLPRSPEGGGALAEVLRAPCRTASLALAAALAVAWIHGWILPGGEPSWAAAALISLALAAHALRRPLPVLGEAALIFPCMAAVALAAERGAGLPAIASGLAIALLALERLAILLARFPGWKVSRAFAAPARRISLWGLAALLAGELPRFAADNVPGLLPEIDLWLPARVLIVLWAPGAARRARSLPLGALACAGAFALLGSCFLRSAGPHGLEWLPAAWAAAGLAAVPALSALRRGIERRRERGAGSRDLEAIAVPAAATCRLVFVLTALLPLVSFTWPSRAAGLVGLAGVLALERRSPARLAAAGLLASMQALSLELTLLFPSIRSPLDLGGLDLLPAALPLALTAAIILALLCARPPRHPQAAAVAWPHRVLLRSSTALLLFASLGLPGLSAAQIALAAGAFALLAATETWTALRRKDAGRVWAAEGAVLAGAGYLAFFGVIRFGHGVSLYATLAAGLLSFGLGRLAARRQGTEVLAGPLRLTGMLLPLATVALAVGRHLADRPAWLGAGSFALLLAAGFYFWRGLEERRPWLMVLAAGIVDVALALLWRELRWTDPQLFLVPVGASVLASVELLRDWIPPRSREPLRYLGALIVLVSPTFHIVEGSWLHLVSLMAISTGSILAALGMRQRALLYSGTAFLVADLVAMVVRGTIDRPGLVWVAGLVLGAGCIALAAVFENRREALLQKVRSLAAVLESWN